MATTPFTALVGCAVPIQQAPMGGIAGPRLIEAVTKAGAMGMLTMTGAPPEVLGKTIDALADAGARPVGVSFLVPFLDEAALDVAIEKAPLIDFYHAVPDEALIARAKRGAVLVEWQVGFPEHVDMAADMGCDIVVLRGVEGGGRLHGGRRLRELLDAVVADVTVPLVAAGGIGTRADVEAYLAAGAAAARIGTRLLATEESDAHPLYKQAVIDAGADDSMLTDVYSVMWPSTDHPPHRVLKRSVAEAERITGDIVGEMVIGATTFKVPKYAVPPPNASATGHVEAMAMYAGVAAAHVHGVERAGDVIAALAPA